MSPFQLFMKRTRTISGFSKDLIRTYDPISEDLAWHWFIEGENPYEVTYPITIIQYERSHVFTIFEWNRTHSKMNDVIKYRHSNKVIAGTQYNMSYPFFAGMSSVSDPSSGIQFKCGNFDIMIDEPIIKEGYNPSYQLYIDGFQLNKNIYFQHEEFLHGIDTYMTNIYPNQIIKLYTYHLGEKKYYSYIV